MDEMGFQTKHVVLAVHNGGYTDDCVCLSGIVFKDKTNICHEQTEKNPKIYRFRRNRGNRDNTDSSNGMLLRFSTFHLVTGEEAKMGHFWLENSPGCKRSGKTDIT